MDVCLCPKTSIYKYNVVYEYIVEIYYNLFKHVAREEPNQIMGIKTILMLKFSFLTKRYLCIPSEDESFNYESNFKSLSTKQ